MKGLNIISLQSCRLNFESPSNRTLENGLEERRALQQDTLQKPRDAVGGHGHGRGRGETHRYRVYTEI